MIMKKVVFFLLVFLVIGGYMIAESSDTESIGGKITFAKTFFGWLSNVGLDVEDVVGYAAEKDWLPEINDTNNSNFSED
jgi:hypothetical protein